MRTRDPRKGDEELSRSEYLRHVPLPGRWVLRGKRAEGTAQEGGDAADTPATVRADNVHTYNTIIPELPEECHEKYCG